MRLLFFNLRLLLDVLFLVVLHGISITVGGIGLLVINLFFLNFLLLLLDHWWLLLGLGVFLFWVLNLSLSLSDLSFWLFS